MNLKKITLTVLAIISIQFTTQAQTSLSCTYREYCTWNESSEEFENCEGYEESSLFVLNDEETMLTHTTETMNSTYYLSNREYDSENGVYTFDATSDVGNKYYYVFDLDNKQIRLLFIRDDKTMLLRFTVKAVF
ncbi:MAG: hypothetical protein OSA46_05315 [Schleiferiaceae bacterium]|nr:hypothetical protein [Schleiferiaceae bacterium]